MRCWPDREPDREEQVQLSGHECVSETAVQVYEYAAIPESDFEAALPWEAIEVDTQGNPMVADEPVELEEPQETGEPAAEVAARDIEEEARLNFEAGWAQGIEAGKKTEREAIASARVAADAARLAEVKVAVARMMESFEEERDRYLHAVEREAVKLAMAVAARILRREAQMDPLMLLGAVRVALGQLSDSTVVRLRVPTTDMKLWSEAVALLPGRNLKPDVLPGEGMRLGECVVETDLGKVDLGVRTQLGEIERGFFDRAPAAAELQKAVLAESLA